MPAEAEPPDSSPTSTIRLLVVDSDPDARASFRDALSGRFDIVEAASAAEALAYLGSRWVSIVVADYELSDHDGVWLLEQVLERFPYTQRILMSARAVPNVRGLRDAGVFRLFFAKPVAPEKFSAYIVSRG